MIKKVNLEKLYAMCCNITFFYVIQMLTDFLKMSP